MLLIYRGEIYTTKNVSLFTDEQIIADEETSSVLFQTPLEFGVYNEITFDATKTEPDAPYIDEIWAGPIEEGFSIFINNGDMPSFEQISLEEAIKIKKALYYGSESSPFVRTTFAQAEATGAVGELRNQYQNEFDRSLDGAILAVFSNDYQYIDTDYTPGSGYNTYGTIFLFQVNGQYYLHFVTI